MDDAFDDPDYDPFDTQSRKEGPNIESERSTAQKGPSDSDTDDSHDRKAPDTEMDSGEEGSEQINGDPIVMDNENTEDTEDVSERNDESTDEVTLSVDEALSQEDIEALFDD